MQKGHSWGSDIVLGMTLGFIDRRTEEERNIYIILTFSMAVVACGLAQSWSKGWKKATSRDREVRKGQSVRFSKRCGQR